MDESIENRTKNMVMDSCGHGSMKRWTEKRKLTERSKWMDEWLDRQKDRQFNREVNKQIDR